MSIEFCLCRTFVDVHDKFYFFMFLVYTVVAAGWGWLCYKNLHDLLPIQVSRTSSETRAPDRRSL